MGQNSLQYFKGSVKGKNPNLIVIIHINSLRGLKLTVSHAVKFRDSEKSQGPKLTQRTVDN